MRHTYEFIYKPSMVVLAAVMNTYLRRPTFRQSHFKQRACIMEGRFDIYLLTLLLQLKIANPLAVSSRNI